MAHLIGLLALAPSPCHGQYFELEEITVTVQKREQDLQDVGVSVSAFTGRQIEALGWSDSLDVAAQTPGLVATNNSGDANVTLFSIRGINQGDYTENQEAPIAIYIDEVYLSSPGISGFPIYDIARIEVLRGPQGTLYGRNATGGLVHYIGRKPSDTWEASLDLTLASYDQRKVVATLNGPLSDNTQGRLSLYKNQHAGYVKNRIGPDLREDDTDSFRAQLNWDINNNHSLLFNTRGVAVNRAKGGVYEYRASQIEADGIARFCDGCGYVLDFDNDGNFDNDDGDNEPLAGEFNDIGFVDRTYKAGTIKYTGDFDHFQLTSITDFTTSDKRYFEEDDSTKVDYYEYSAGADIDQFSQELRVSAGDENIQWIAGAFYMDIGNTFYGSFPSPINQYFARFDAHQDTRTWSVFGQLEHNVTESLSYTLGARWTHDDKDMRYQFTQCDDNDMAFDGFCPQNGVTTDPNAAAADPAGLFGFVVDGVPRNYARQDGDYSGKIQLDWRPDVEHLHYVSVNRGLKGGGFNASLDGFLTDDQVPFDSEILTAYELGSKNGFFDGRLKANASLFYYDYDNYQAFFFQGTTNFVKNASAQMQGMEIEFIATPTAQWKFLLGASLLDATVYDVEIFLPAGGSRIDDQQVILAPELSVNGLVRREWQLANGIVAAQLSASYNSEQFFNTVNHETTRGKPYTLANANISFGHASEDWSINLFVKNLTDERAHTFGYDISAAGNYSILTYGPPRWVGVSGRYTLR
jgi:iron complex outermembrane recepter protein